MEGGNLKVIKGSLNVEGTLSGTAKDLEISNEGSLYAGKYELKIKGNKLKPQGGEAYTSQEFANTLEKEVKNLKEESELLEKFKKATRVKPYEAYERYKKIKAGKETELYSINTL